MTCLGYWQIKSSLIILASAAVVLGFSFGVLRSVLPPNQACSGPGGGPCKNGGVQAKAFVRFVGWFSHEAANAHRWAADI
jgi:hypothetical protein